MKWEKPFTRRIRKIRKLSGNSSAESQRDSGLQPRVARNELPWESRPKTHNPNGVAAGCWRRGATPLGLKILPSVTQGSSFLATLGWRTQPRWGWGDRRPFRIVTPLSTVGESDLAFGRQRQADPATKTPTGSTNNCVYRPCPTVPPTPRFRVVRVFRGSSPPPCLSVLAKVRTVRTWASVSLSSVRNGGEGRGEAALRNVRPLVMVKHPAPRSCLTGRGRRTRYLSQRSRHELSQRLIA